MVTARVIISFGEIIKIVYIIIVYTDMWVVGYYVKISTRFLLYLNIKWQIL